MMNSMTGFGRGEANSPGRRVTVEIRSINNRYCDIQIRLPRQIGSYETRIRQAVAARASRGKIDVYVSHEDTRDETSAVRCDIGLARAYVRAMKDIGEAIGSDERIGVSHIARFPDVLSVENGQDEDPEELWNLVEEALGRALDGITGMKSAEGRKLAEDILLKIDDLERSRESLMLRAPLVPEEYRLRLDMRITELLGSRKGEIMDPARLAGEIALFADKCAIDEELVRLHSHLSQFREALKAGGVVGKKLDFIVQEINREINTVGSKANDIEITNLVIGMKSELEKIREQIQNIE